MLEPEIKVYAQAGLGFFVSYIDPFTKRRVKQRVGEREEAEEYREKIRAELTQAITSNPKEMLVQDLMRIHLRDYPNTELARPGLLLDFLNSFGTLKIREITTDVLRSWIELKRTDLRGCLRNVLGLVARRANHLGINEVVRVHFSIRVEDCDLRFFEDAADSKSR